MSGPENQERGRAQARRPPRAGQGPPVRTVMVFPTRDGDHIEVTISIGKFMVLMHDQERIVIMTNENVSQFDFSSSTTSKCPTCPICSQF